MAGLAMIHETIKCSGEAEMKNGVCCFCAKVVDESGLDPCTLSIATNAEGSQSWPYHAACYLERLGNLPYGRKLFETDD
jgi:hypothetical protein